MSKVFGKIDDVIRSISTAFIYVSAAALFLIAFLSFCDVIGRYFFNSPIRGAQELVELSMSVFVYMGIGMATRRRRLINVPVILEKMPIAAGYFFKTYAGLICCGISVLLCRQLGLSAINYYGELSSATQTFKIPLWPFYTTASVCCGLMALEMLARCIKDIAAGVKALKAGKAGRKDEARI
ncbi:MAG: TRAP transporter small permease [Oscillospiraceae bacterium]|nr:TRAP transporter small permease [Oscillospiraceae bacterium]